MADREGQVRHEWVGKTTFQEVAEALHVNTDQIVAWTGRIALFTPTEDDTDVWMAFLRQDNDGIWHETSRMPSPTMTDYMRKLKRRAGETSTDDE
jgi:hypothetical protein